MCKRNCTILKFYWFTADLKVPLYKVWVLTTGHANKDSVYQQQTLLASIFSVYKINIFGNGKSFWLLSKCHLKFKQLYLQGRSINKMELHSVVLTWYYNSNMKDICKNTHDQLDADKHKTDVRILCFKI
jgi:hypothetical protein